METGNGGRVVSRRDRSGNERSKFATIEGVSHVEVTAITITHHPHRSHQAQQGNVRNEKNRERGDEIRRK